MRILPVPELEVQRMLKDVLRFLYDEAHKTDSIFELWFGDQKGGRFEYAEQAKAIFATPNSDPRHISISVGYNIARKGPPTIHIILPQEQTQSSIGNNLGYAIEPQVYEKDGQTYQRDFYGLQVNVNYQIMITSDNAPEAILIYHCLRATLLSLTPELEKAGLRNVSYAGADLQMDNEIVPSGIFHRNLLLQFFYEAFSPQLDWDLTYSGIHVSGEITSDGSQI